MVRIADLEVTTSVSALAKVDDAARDLVAAATAQDSRAVPLTIDLRDTGSVSDLLDAASAARQDADGAREAAGVRQALARRLATAGFAVGDIACLLGMSRPRVRQLVTEEAPLSARSGPDAPVSRPSAPAFSQPAQARDTCKPHESYQHEAFMYAGEEEFLAELLPFVHEGQERAQPVLVAVAEPRLTLLRDALGGDTEGVQFVDMGALGGNPARIIPRWRGFIEDRRSEGSAAQPLRGIGEPVWDGRRRAEVVECQLHEALLNLAVDPDTPLWLRCPYDVKALDACVVDAAYRSHPTVVDANGYRGSTSYGGLPHVEELFAAALPEPSTELEEEEFCFGAGELDAVRQRVTRQASSSGLSSARKRALAVAVGEIAGNSIRHGGGGGVLRVWRDSDALVCEIFDRGHIIDPLAGRRMPPLPDVGGARGLWLANQISDLVQLRSTPAGTVGRVHAWL